MLVQKYDHPKKFAQFSILKYIAIVGKLSILKYPISSSTTYDYFHFDLLPNIFNYRNASCSQILCILSGCSCTHLQILLRYISVTLTIVHMMITAEC